MHVHEWEYFLALEEDLERCTRYVEFDPRNLSTFSIEFAKLLLAAGSEVDVLAKMICNKLDPTAPAGNIDQYRLCIMAHRPAFADAQVKISRYFRDPFTPWATWKPAAGGSPTNPTWWHSYNKVKHERNRCFDQATLSNVLDAFAGYFAALLTCLEVVHGNVPRDDRRRPLLFDHTTLGDAATSIALAMAGTV
jgi:hypothetical protein